MIKFVVSILVLLGYGSIVSSSTNPMFDPYIDTITHLSLSELMRIPEKSDEQFLYDLVHGDDSIQGVTHRLTGPTESDVKRMDQVSGQAEMDEDWEKLMIAGPIAVNYVGNLMVLASKKDFPFSAPANYEFRYIRFPTSFQATLAQVASEMYSALLGAHTAMDRIQNGVKQIPGHVKTILKLVTTGSPTMVKKLLSLSINHIARLANDSVILANRTVDQFTNLLNLLDEISQLNIVTGSANKVLLENNEKQMNESIAKQQELDKQVASAQKQYKIVQAELEAARLAYKAAYDAIPNGGAVIVPRPRVINTFPLQQSSRSITATIAVIASVVSVIDAGVSVLGKIFGLGEKNKEPITFDNSAHTNAMEKAKLALEHLQQAEEAHRIQFEQHLLDQNKLAATMREMAQLDLTKLSIEEIGAILVKATEEIIQIRIQWAKLVQFFSKVSLQADTAQQVIVAEFIGTIEALELDKEPLPEGDRSFFLELLIPQVALIDREASLLYTMAVTYYKVSAGYMLDQIAGVTTLLVTQTDQERQKQLQLASNLTTTNSQKVSTLATQMRAQFIKETDELETMYQNYIDELLAAEFGSMIG